jgi:hypothetical protein
MLIVILSAPSGSLAQKPEAEFSVLRIIVVDPQGAVIASARVTAKPSKGSPQELQTDERGEALFTKLSRGECVVHVEADGFKPRDVDKVALKPGTRNLEVRLEVEGAVEEVNIKRDEREKITDPKGDAFTTILTQDQIDQMPDDPDEFANLLQQIAGPGGIIRVNGFRGGKLPPKSQIREIRIHRNPYAAENHFAGFISIDIYTKPGVGLWHGTMNFGFRNDATMARNAFADFKGPEQYRRFGMDADGPLFHNSTSLALSAEEMQFYDSKTVVAALPQGDFRTLVQPLTRTLYMSARVEQVLSKTHTLRAEYQRNANLQGDLGVGNFDLPSRAFSSDSVEQIFRLSDSGLLTKHSINEFRLQETFTTVDTGSVTQGPAVIVSGAFSSGGASVDARRRTSDLELADNVDFLAGKNSLRAGILVDAISYHTRDQQNTEGTFLFSSLSAFTDGKPSTFSQRIGNPGVRFNQYEFGSYIQDDIRLHKKLSLSLGLRHEFQSNAGSYANFAPRLGIAWSPLKKTVIRAGAGIFYSWLDPDTFDRAIRDDGRHMHDLLILNPGFPDPLAAGHVAPLPPGRTLFDPSLRVPYVEQASVAIERQVGKGLNLNVDYLYARTVHALRGHDINAPVPAGGVPDPNAGVVNQIESTGNSRLHLASVSANRFTPRVAFFADYIWSRATDDNDGPFSLPSNNFNLAADRGPASGDARHRFYCSLNVNLGKGVGLGSFFHADSATPYNITTGLDNNHDFVFNDRPEGVGRNSARGAGQWELGTRLGWRFGFGKPRTAAGTRVRAQVVRSGEEGAAMGPLPGMPGERPKRWTFQVYVQAYNLLNHVNKVNFVGVETSPFFGQPTAALPGRRLETGLRFGF